MGLQDQIAEAIVLAFDELGGNPNMAIEAAKQHDTVESWLQQETTKVAFAGGAEMAIPGLHALTIPAGISYLIHKMAHISWGVGTLKGAYVIETAQHSDLRNILTLWANGSYFNAHILEHLSISMSAFEYVLTDEGYVKLSTALEKGAEIDNVVLNTLDILQTLAQDFPGDERAQRMVETITGQAHMQDLVISAKDHIPTARVGTLDKPMNSRISAKLAGRLATQISMRVPARVVMGFIPLAGPIVNAIFNAQTLNSMADSATKYYDHQLTQKSFE